MKSCFNSFVNVLSMTSLSVYLERHSVSWGIEDRCPLELYKVKYEPHNSDLNRGTSHGPPSWIFFRI